MLKLAFAYFSNANITIFLKLHFFPDFTSHCAVAMTEEEIQAKKDAHKDHIAAVEKFSKSLPFCWEAAA